MRAALQADSVDLRQEVPLLLPKTIGGGLLLLGLVTPWGRGLFAQQGLQEIYVFLFAVTAALVLTPWMIRLGYWLGVVDLPGERKIHAHATPRVGGLAIYAGCLGALMFGADLLDNGLGAIVLGGSLLLIVGLADDFYDLPAGLKLGAQVLAALLVVSSGTLLTLFPTGPIGYLANILITLIWIVGITNAFNFFDGMDGLATGLAILLALFLGSVALQTGQLALGFLAAAIIGAGLGFFPYNMRMKKPALIFLGDSGSTFLGFVLACLAVKGEWAHNDPIVSFSNPLLIFGVLIYDMIHITVERIATGKVRSVRGWIDYVGKDHLHHRLERALGGRLPSIAMIFTLTICLGLAAMVVRRSSTGDAILLLTQAALIVIMVTILEHAGRR